MRINLLLFLVLLHFHFSYTALPFDCSNTDELQADAALESEFSTTYNREYFISGMSINIDVTKDAGYDASNVKGVFFSVFGVHSNGSVSTSFYGEFPVINTVNTVTPTVNTPCGFITFAVWPGDIDLYWKAGDAATYPDTLRLCVGIAVTESPLTGYLDCTDIRRAEAVTKPDITSGHGSWYGPIDLHCSVTVFPSPEFNWYYNDVRIQDDYNYFIRDTTSPSDGIDWHTHTLTVKRASTNDTIFNYHCTVTNILQTTEVRSDDAVLTIADRSLSLLDGPNSNLNGFLLESIVISCTFQSYPRPLILWEKEGTAIVNSSSIVIIPGTERMDSGGIIVESSLAFSSLSHTDSGNYACIAMRGGGSMVSLDQPFTLDIISASRITFLTSPSVAVVGTYVSLNCQTSGVPPPTIKWFNSAGMEIGTTSSISVRVMNAGVNTWLCEASNAGGDDTASTSVTGYLTSANITKPPGDSTVAYRDRASFMCGTSGDPVPAVKWYFTGSGAVEVEVTADDETYSISDSSLVIQRPTLKEQGTYRCEASNIANTVSASATLTIQIMRPSIMISPISQDVIYNEEHIVTCESSGLPPPTVFIRTPDATKVPSPHTITSFTEVDVGLYQCVAVSPANGDVAVQSAVYSLEPLTVDVTPSVSTVDITSSDVVTLTCNVQGTPTYSSITWYHKNLCSEEIVPISGVAGFTQSLNKLSIIPTSVNTFLPGIYICGVARFSVEYIGTASITVSSVTDTISFDLALSDYDCPNLSGGQSRQFDCSATSSESNPITYTWFLNQQIQDPGSVVSSLLLSSNGYGHYRCVATAGQLCEYIHSDVNGGLSVGILFEPPTPLNVEDSLTIKCIADGFPTSAITYSWFKDGTPIPSQTSSELSIGAVTTADSGEYKCSVNLTACPGSMESPVGTVIVTQSSPVISSQQNDLDIELGRNKLLACSGTGIPTPNYQWYRNGVPIQNAESDSYRIISASTADNGLYSCELFSYVDRSFQDIAEIYTYQVPTNITVSGIPSSPVEKGVTIILTCAADGIPAPTYQWFDSNGTLLTNQAVVEITIVADSVYTCTAVNGRGVAEQVVMIPVIPDPSELLIILPVVLAVCACFVMLLMVCSVVTMWILNFRRKAKTTKGVIAEDSNVLLEDRVIPDEDKPVISEDSSKASTPSITGVVENESVVLQGGLDRSNPLTPTQLQIVISTVAKSGGYDGDNDLNAEFESTPSNMSKWTELPKDCEIKNRYMNVLPNQDTMVELSDTGESGSTYINANFIPNFRSKTSYIAAQGPLPSTIIDFWRMVWENDVSAVVMTCLLFERKRIRCARYWPDTQQRPTEIYGHFKVSIDSFAKTEDYEVSMLYLVNLKAGPNEVQKKQVYHYWYKSWPTYGVPNETNRIWKFLEELHTTLEKSSKPILFHCSAGIGRTAVFIGADMGMQEFKSTGKVDPVKYLCLLRKGRGGSIQTAEQYLYLHSVVSDYISARQSVI